MFRLLTIAAILLFGLQIALYGQVQLLPETAEGLLLERPAPVPSELAVRARMADATLKFLVNVSENGIVTNFKIISGNPLLDGSAADVILKSRYKPYLVDGKAVPFVTVADVHFVPDFSKSDYERDQRLASLYYQQADRCRELLNASKWQQAEEACSTNLELVEKLGKHRNLAKMRAYQMAGLSLLGQDKYKEASSYLNRAQKFGNQASKDNDGELGDLLVMLGLTHSKMGKLDEARDFYIKGEKKLQFAYEHAGNSYLKNLYLPRLKKALEYHMQAAEAAGAAREVEALKKRIAGLP